MKYQIWCEGYSATGESSRAILLGDSSGKTFEQACKTFMKKYDWQEHYYNVDNNTYWGCKLYKSETKARKNFG